MGIILRGGDQVELIYKSTVPNKEEFYGLYETTGLNSNNAYSKEDLFTAINNSWYLISVYKSETLIGFGHFRYIKHSL